MILTQSIKHQFLVTGQPGAVNQHHRSLFEGGSGQMLRDGYKYLIYLDIEFDDITRVLKKRNRWEIPFADES
jgi:hypothetical protein